MAKWILKFGSYKTKNDIFDAVKSGKKTVETRPINPKSKKNYAHILPGDILTLVSLDNGERIEKKATFVHIYSSVKSMAEAEIPIQIFPEAKNAFDLISVFEEFKRKWGSAYAQKLENYGIVAIGME